MITRVATHHPRAAGKNHKEKDLGRLHVSALRQALFRSSTVEAFDIF